MSIDKAKATELRKPFPKESIGQLPKGGQLLDYVGHAAVTDRLLTVDPEWSWEPFAIDEHGLPAMQGRNLWIRLTICGVTRIGVGDGQSAKECIGDAIRNAAMRFGVALDLWAKENLVEFAQAAAASQNPPRPADPAQRPLDLQGELANDMYAAYHAAAVDVPLSAYVGTVLGRDVGTPPDMTEADAAQVTQALSRLPRRPAGEVAGGAEAGEAAAAPASQTSPPAPPAPPAGSADEGDRHRPVAGGEPDPAASARAHPALISRPQQRMLLGLFSKFDLTGDDTRDERLRIVSALAGRGIESTSALTKAEANRVITTLGEVEDVAQLLAIANGGAQ